MLTVSIFWKHRILSNKIECSSQFQKQKRFCQLSLGKYKDPETLTKIHSKTQLEENSKQCKRNQWYAEIVIARSVYKKHKLVHSKTLKQVPEEKNMKESSKASVLKELQADPHELQKSTIVLQDTPPPPTPKKIEVQYSKRDLKKLFLIRF